MKKVTIPLLAVLLVATIVVAHAGIIISTIEPIPYGQPELVEPSTVTAPAAAPAAPAAAPAAPASIGDFVVTDITCDPSRIIAGSPINFIVTVKNEGASESTETLVLNVDGVEVDTEEVTLAAGASTEVTFKHRTKTTVTPEELGQTYQGAEFAPEGAPVERDVTVEVGGVTTTFTLAPTPFMPVT